VIHEQTAVGEKKQRNGLMWRGVTVGLATVVAAETVVAIALLPVSSNQKTIIATLALFSFIEAMRQKYIQTKLNRISLIATIAIPLVMVGYILIKEVYW
jgi:hypothetical protein